MRCVNIDFASETCNRC